MNTHLLTNGTGCQFWWEIITSKCKVVQVRTSCGKSIGRIRFFHCGLFLPSGRVQNFMLSRSRETVWKSLRKSILAETKSTKVTRQERNSFAWISEQTVGARKFKGKSRLDQNASLNAYFLTRVVCMPSDYVNIGQLCRHSFAWHAMPVWLTRSDPNLCRYNAKKAAWTDQQIRNMQSWQKRARTQL